MAIALGANTPDVSPGFQPTPRDTDHLPSRATCPDGRELPCEVAAFVANLPCQQRTALMLRRFHQRGYADIAATLGCTEQEAHDTVHEALRSLRAHLGDRI